MQPRIYILVKSVLHMVKSRSYDVIVIGAGAAGLMAAAAACERGHKVAVLEMGAMPARKVLQSGGGRCNFTNTAAGVTRYFGQNPRFVLSALKRVSAYDMLEWAKERGILLEEKTPGRYFCTNGAKDVVNNLMADTSNVDIFFNINVQNVEKRDDLFWLNDKFAAKALIVATGGVSFAALGVSDLGYKIARKFGHTIVPVRPALCALKITDMAHDLSGISLDVEIKIGLENFVDSLLFTHFGIGGPAAYRASLYNLSDGIYINFLPGQNLFEILKTMKTVSGRKTVVKILSDLLPLRVAKWLAPDSSMNIADMKDAELKKISDRISSFYIPANKIKYHTLASAEVTFGGVSTAEISSKTMESKLCPGLFFAGEVLDITGDLGGFNLQWAWSSGRIAGLNA